jgi:signal transduction histidine kinase/ActR/RegA family two-component response regulator
MVWRGRRRWWHYVVGLTGLFAVYETLKQHFFPHITLWGSHVVSIAVVGLLATGIGLCGDRLFQAQLVRAQQLQAQAEEANRSKSAFLSRMSHELRTPLTAILGFAEVLLADPGGPVEPRAQHILDAGQHLLGLINEVLDISRIETGQMAVQPQAVSLAAMAAECRDLLAPLAAEAGVSVAVCAASDVTAYVQADPQRLKQVLVNLVSNAIKYNRRDGTVRLWWAVNAEGRGRLLVTDTGEGLSPEQIARLFQPFERLGGRGVEGTGLGLVLSKCLVELMGGTLGVESTPGDGSTFWVELPRAAPPPAVAEAPVEATRASPAVAGHTALLIEDNPAIVALLESILAQRRGVRLRTAYRGAVGLELARAQRPDLILLDVHLPDMDGDAVVRQLQSNPETQGIPVVAVSADATAEQEERLLRAGAHAYLVKPLDVRALLRVVDSVVPGAGAKDDAGSGPGG